MKSELPKAPACVACAAELGPTIAAVQHDGMAFCPPCFVHDRRPEALAGANLFALHCNACGVLAVAVGGSAACAQCGSRQVSIVGPAERA